MPERTLTLWVRAPFPLIKSCQQTASLSEGRRTSHVGLADAAEALERVAEAEAPPDDGYVAVGDANTALESKVTP